jgi:hypothetical protein
MAESMSGFQVDEIGGSKVGAVHSVYFDAESGEPVWLIAALGRRRSKLVAVPIAECVAAAGRVWVPHDRRTLQSAPGIDPTRPLLREHELTICEHYGIGEKVGRAAEVAGRPADAVSSKPQ